MNKSYSIAKQAMIAAMYIVLSVVLTPITYGAVQARISEAFTLLPVFGFNNICGVTVGCFLTNLIGFLNGTNILGSLDIFFGTFATFVAAIMSYCLRNIRVKGLAIAAAIPPIVLNAVVIGWELCVMIAGGFNWSVFAAQAVSVALGQIISCLIIGVIMVKGIENNSQLKEFVSK